MAKGQAARKGKRGRKGRAIGARENGSGNGVGIDLRRLKGLDVEALVSLRGKIDSLVRIKAPTLKARIKSMQVLLSAISA
jgi:hypothetical protein